MHVAQIIDSLDWGGAQKMQVFLTQSLCSMGIDVTIISLKEGSDSSIPQELVSAGARVVSFPFPNLFRPDSFYRLVKFMYAEKFDVVQAYLSYANILGSLAGLITRTPVIASLRNAGYDPKIITKQRAFIENVSLRYFPTRVMANGYMVAEYWKPLLKNMHIDVIVNAVRSIPPLEVEERIALRTELIGDPNRPLILSVGRLTPQKAFPDLIRAFAKVHELFPTAALVIAGRGRLLDELSQLAHELGIGDDVHFLGIRNDVDRLMGAADVYVNSSHWEGTPVSVLEAMAAGLPVVATSVGETPYLLRKDVGLLVPPSQIDILAESILKLLSSSEMRERFSIAARSRIENEYTSEAWRRNLLNLYALVSPNVKKQISLLDVKTAVLPEKQ